MEFIGFYITALVVGLFLGFATGCAWRNRKWKAYTKQLTAVKQGKLQLKEKLQALVDQTYEELYAKANECYRSIDKVFKEQ